MLLKDFLQKLACDLRDAGATGVVSVQVCVGSDWEEKELYTVPPGSGAVVNVDIEISPDDEPG